MQAQQEGFPLLSVSESPLNVIHHILATQILVTSSLHGLILAEAYGVTAVLLRDREQKWEPHFKFLDYFLSTGRGDQTLWNISIKEAIQHIPKMTCPIPIDTKNVLRAAGYGKVVGNIRSGMSGLDATYKILSESGQPINAKTITKIALEQEIWNPQGSTPDMTLSAALQTDVRKKGDKSRFAKANQPGHYIARTAQ
jgi:hypothetical protein